MRKIEKRIIDVIRCDLIGSHFGTLRLSCRDAVCKDDDGYFHVILHETDICKISPYSGLMRINLHGFGTPTTMSRIRALLEAFQDGFTLTRDPHHKYYEWSEWKQCDVSRSEPLLISPCGQRALIRDTEVLVFSDRIQHWDADYNFWEDYPYTIGEQDEN